MDRSSRLSRLKRGFIRLATNYTIAFIIVISISVGTSLFTINYMGYLEKDLNDVFENEIMGQDYIQVAYSKLLIIENAVKDIIIYADPETTAASLTTIRKSTEDLKAAINDATPRFYTPAGKEILAQSKKDMKSFIAFLGTVTNQLSNNPSLDLDVLSKLRGRKDRLQADFKHLIANKSANSTIGFRDIINQLRLSLFVTVLIVIGSVIIRVSMYLAQRHHDRMQRQQAPRIEACVEPGPENLTDNPEGEPPSAPSSPPPVRP